MPNGNHMFGTNNISYPNLSGINAAIFQSPLNASNDGAFPLVGVTGLQLFGFTNGEGSGNATAFNVNLISLLQGIGYPTYTDTGLSVEHNGSVQRIGVQPYSGSNSSNNNNMRFYKNGSLYQVPFLSPSSTTYISNSTINLSSLSGNVVGTGVTGIGGTFYMPFAPGSQTITIPTGLSISNGQTVYVSANTSNYFWGTVTNYTSSNGSLTINSYYAIGSGTYSTWTVNFAPLGAGNVKICKNGTVYSLPCPTPIQPVDAAGYSGYNTGLVAGYNFSGGGSYDQAVQSLFNQPYTLVAINYAIILYAYGYGDNGHDDNLNYSLNYSTQPVGQPPSWITLSSYSVGN
jgi:hypothetical protein